MTFSRILLQWLLIWLNLAFRHRIYVVHLNKRRDYMSCGSIRTSWELWKWIRLDLVFKMRYLQISSNLDAITKFRVSSKVSCLKISFHGISLKVVDHEDHLNRHEYSENLCHKKEHPLWAWRILNGNRDQGGQILEKYRKSLKIMENEKGTWKSWKNDCFFPVSHGKSWKKINLPTNSNHLISCFPALKFLDKMMRRLSNE